MLQKYINDELKLEKYQLIGIISLVICTLCIMVYDLL